MGNEKLISELSSYMSEMGLKNKQVETDLGLPQNSLSNFLSFKKELPKKWGEPILKYVAQSNIVINTLGNLKDKVTTADKIPVPEKLIDGSIIKQREADEEIVRNVKSLCALFKTNSHDLFSWLMDNYGKPKKTYKIEGEDVKSDTKISVSNFAADLRIKKCGLGKE